MNQQHLGHHIVSSIVYGPVVSRRFGHSLGINLLPTNNKICNFDCIYCQLGYNAEHRPSAETQFPTSEEVNQGLKSWSADHTNVPLDTVCVGGNGEPTLNPDFLQISKNISLWCKSLGHHIKLICLTNGTRIMLPDVKAALKLYDEFSLKIDAEPEKTNLVHFDQSRIKPHLHEFDSLVVQSCFYQGTQSNSDDASIQKWIEVVSTLPAKRIDLYTISRNPAMKGLEPVSNSALLQIAERAKLHMNCPVRLC